MKKILLITLLLSACFSVHSQLVVTNTETPEELILNTFMGQNTSITNVKFNGSTANAQMIRDQAGRFSNGSVGLSVNQGLILATGKAILAVGPNNQNGGTDPTSLPVLGDPDLAMITLNTIRNVGIIEFDFVPNFNSVLFEYIFASEEYSTFANSNFNDVFGLFLSGPGISGPYSNNAINIATIPGTSLPLTINNLNNGTTNNGPCEYCQYYVNNTTTGQNPTGPSTYQYNARTTELTASGLVTPGQTYHLKFAIANVGDNQLDSGMFLTAGSFRSMLLGNENFTTGKIKMYPNPANDMVHISAAENISGVTIYDLQGRSLINTSTSGSDLDINTSELSTGTYVVEFVMNNNERITQKLVVR